MSSPTDGERLLEGEDEAYSIPTPALRLQDVDPLSSLAPPSRAHPDAAAAPPFPSHSSSSVSSSSIPTGVMVMSNQPEPPQPAFRAPSEPFAFGSVTYATLGRGLLLGLAVVVVAAVVAIIWVAQAASPHHARHNGTRATAALRDFKMWNPV